MTSLLTQMGLSSYSNHTVRVGDVDVFPCRFFYPYNWLEDTDANRITSGTYAVHYGAQSWQSYASPDTVLERLRHRKYRVKTGLYRLIGRL
jgi:hypothetical protein